MTRTWLALAGAALALAMPASARTYDRGAFSETSMKIGSLLMSDEFDALERMHEEFLDVGARTPDGTWMMEAFEFGLDPLMTALPRARIEKTFVSWKEKNPVSTLRPTLEAYTGWIRAMQVRGSRCSARAPRGAFRVYDSLLARADEVLAEAGAPAKRSPLWHFVSILVAGAREAPDLDARFAEAQRAFPDYQRIYAARMEYLLPDWGGDYARVDHFIRESVTLTEASEGRSFYARLYVDLARSRDCMRRLEESAASWPEMKAAFDDLVERRPDVWNKNLYATFACRMRDVETTRRLLGELGTSAKLGAWSSGISTDSCYRMVKPPARAPERT